MRLAPWLPLLVPVGSFRLVHFIVFDALARRPRGWVTHRSTTKRDRRLEARTDEWWNDHAWRRPFAYRAKLVSCSWCVSMWVALVVVVAMLVDPEWTARVLAVPAVATLAMLVEVLLDRLEAPDDEDEDDGPREAPAHVQAALREA